MSGIELMHGNSIVQFWSFRRLLLLCLCMDLVLVLFIIRCHLVFFLLVFSCFYLNKHMVWMLFVYMIFS